MHTGIGGGVLTSDSANAAPADRKFFGSCIIIETESLEAVRNLIEDDAYYKAGVVNSMSSPMDACLDKVGQGKFTDPSDRIGNPFSTRTSLDIPLRSRATFVGISSVSELILGWWVTQFPAVHRSCSNVIPSSSRHATIASWQGLAKVS